MPVEPDDLDKLLIAVRKTIKDNLQFLKGLDDETVDVSIDPVNAEENGEGEDEEEFEEL